MNKDLYAILGVDRSADDKKLKSAYRKLAKKYHPDANPGDKNAEQKFKELKGFVESVDQNWLQGRSFVLLAVHVLTLLKLICQGKLEKQLMIVRHPIDQIR